MPIIVVAPDPEGSIAASLAGAEVTLAVPVASIHGPVGQIARGIDVAAAAVSDTTATLIWPAGLTWAGPETAGSLIEAHGMDRRSLLRPAFHGEAGWPVLLPLEALADFRDLPTTAMPDELLAGIVAIGAIDLRVIDLGDPGTVIDGATRREDMPPYEGPADPTGGRSNEWGASAAGTPDEAPMAAPETIGAELD
jgi:hypothetical protein